MVRTLTQQAKFKIAYRDNFTCQFCGAKPGNDLIEIEHLIPVSQHGSDNPENLIAACKKCNRSKSDFTMFPVSMCEGPDVADPDWTVHKSWGEWKIMWHPELGVVLELTTNGYWIGGDRAHESDWERHIGEKLWPLPHKMEDFISALTYFRKLTRP